MPNSPHSEPLERCASGIRLTTALANYRAFLNNVIVVFLRYLSKNTTIFYPNLLRFYQRKTYIIVCYTSPNKINELVLGELFLISEFLSSEEIFDLDKKRQSGCAWPLLAVKERQIARHRTLFYGCDCNLYIGPVNFPVDFCSGDLAMAKKF